MGQKIGYDIKCVLFKSFNGKFNFCFRLLRSDTFNPAMQVKKLPEGRQSK